MQVMLLAESESPVRNLRFFLVKKRKQATNYEDDEMDNSSRSSNKLRAVLILLCKVSYSHDITKSLEHTMLGHGKKFSDYNATL